MLNQTISGLFVAGLLSVTATAAPLFENNFEQSKLGEVPADFLVLDGGWAVKDAGGNKVIELPGDPLDTFGVLFGPSQVDGVVITTRGKGEGKGRRFPAFAVSLNGVGGYRLQVSASKKVLEIFKGEEGQTSVPFSFESGAWTQLKLQVRKVQDGEWAVEGKAWKDGTPEPKEWTITLKATEAPPEGRPAVWGNPFSGTPIQFDDLKLEAIK
jgi:hypothetical protein